MTTATETIVALATPPGRGGVAIIRVSGPDVLFIAKNILEKIPTPRKILFSAFLDEHKNPLDEGLALFFKGPNSFTGEDVLELHGHGGPAVVDSIIRRVVGLGARIARPGEFSERAFLNNKMDLAQAEAIADLIHASSEQAARASIRSLQGEFSEKINELVEAVIRLRMYVEAAIDFTEEEIDFLSHKEVQQDFDGLLTKLENVLSSATQGSLLRDGITVVIAGEPNVGKSSLLNRLSGKQTAIVTDIPGTTRDILREHIHIDGMPVHFIDTAGLRDSMDPVEQEGIRRAHHEIAAADLVLCVINAEDTIFPAQDVIFKNKAPVVIIRNKIDLVPETPAITEENDRTVISLSAKKDMGIDLLKNHIKHCAGFKDIPEGTFSARRRHLEALNLAKRFLLSAQKQLASFTGELLAEDLRQAQLALSEITGEFTSDDLLGRIFGSFCIGK